MAETNPITTAAFVIYISGVLLLALISHKVMKNREFMGEYFLGSRGMKSWTLAFAFAATATSAGSYIGFPALIYSSGWVLAFWIASYMIYPLTAMGIFSPEIRRHHGPGHFAGPARFPGAGPDGRHGDSLFYHLQPGSPVQGRGYYH